MNGLAILILLTAQDREPVPGDAALKEAEKLVKETFKDEFKGADKKSLARKLLKQGRETSDDLAAKFILLREARDLGAQSGDASTALQAVDALSETFAVDGPVMKNTVLATAAKYAKAVDEYRYLTSAYAKVSDEAMSRDDYVTAEKSAKSALDFAKKAKEVSLTTELEARTKEIANLKSRYEKVKKAKEKLATSPDDAACNSTVGFFLCAVKGDWETGLPMLARGDDAVLKRMADRDLAAPSSGGDQAAVGDDWWDRSDKETGVVRKGLRARAGHWYEKAVSGLSGLAKTKVDKRILEIRRDKYKDGWEEFPDEFAVVVEPGKSKGQAFPQFPSDEIDGVSARILLEKGKDLHGSLVFNTNEMSVGMYMKEFSVAIMKMNTASNKWENVKQVQIPAQEEYLLSVRLTAGELVVSVDGQEKARVKATFARITSLTFQADFGEVVFKQVRLHHK